MSRQRSGNPQAKSSWSSIKHARERYKMPASATARILYRYLGSVTAIFCGCEGGLGCLNEHTKTAVEDIPDDEDDES